jgi:2-oxoglutarate ferredoxin oxidoreductase subunit alpha
MSVASQPRPQDDAPTGKATTKRVREHIVEFVSDSGEGAQTAGQLFGSISAKMGNGVWTVEIIPAEIEPPNRSQAGASGNRIRIGTGPVTNMGDTADLVVAFNEQVLYSRIDVGAFRRGTILLLDDRWATDPQESIRQAYAEALADFDKRGYVVHALPIQDETRKIVGEGRRGGNVWALGVLMAVYDRDLELARKELRKKLARKGDQVVTQNLQLVESGYAWGLENLPFRFQVDVRPNSEPMVVMNGNQAVALGVIAAGGELCAMYPITPATSASHYLASLLPKMGGFLHQAEDEIAAIGFAIGASYAGKTAFTITSGPGLALKTEFMGLAVMAEVPLVCVVVQRGGPSTGLPTRIEQGDLLAALYGQPGEAPKIVMAPSTIEECFHFMVTARKLAETFRTPVLVLTDANLATGQQPFPKPEPTLDWLSPPLDQSDWDPAVKPYDWDPETGLSRRPIPGQKGGAYVLTGLAHDGRSRVAYESAINQETMAARSRKFHTLARSLKPPTVYGGPDGDLLVVGWGSTRGSIEEAVDRVRADGLRVSSVNLRFLHPFEPGIDEIFRRFTKVMTVEINYSDDPDDPTLLASERRYAQLAWLLRAKTLVDVDCWSRVPGTPLPPGVIEQEIRRRLAGAAKQSAVAQAPKGA